jgi:hypothetical protein
MRCRVCGFGRWGSTRWLLRRKVCPGLRVIGIRLSTADVRLIRGVGVSLRRCFGRLDRDRGTSGLFEFKQSDGVLADGFALSVEGVEVGHAVAALLLLLLDQSFQVCYFGTQFLFSSASGVALPDDASLSGDALCGVALSASIVG